MTFPLNLHGQVFDDAPSFAESVLADAIAGGGRVVSDTLPRAWLGVLVDDTHNQRSLLVSLTAWLTRSEHASGICEAIAIAQTYELHELATVFAAALDGLSLGLLLQPNPTQTDLSVEDTLLKGLTHITNGAPDALRTKLLGHLRNAGLRDDELSILVRFGTQKELQTLIPGLIAEALPETSQLRPICTREQDLVLTLGKSLASTPVAYRKSIWTEFTSLVPLLAANKEMTALFTS